MQKNYKKKNLISILSFKNAIIVVVLLFNTTAWGQTYIAGWDFQTTTTGGTAAAASPSAPNQYVSNVNAGTIYLDGTNGSSSWVTASTGNEVTGFGGTALNAGGTTGLSTTTAGISSLALLGGTGGTAANGKTIVFQFSMVGLKSLVVSYATQRTGTGFTTQTWDYSTDGTTWINVTAVTPPTSFAVQTLPSISGLDNITTALLRVTFIGATSAAGNNRLDNIQLNAASSILPITLSSFNATKVINGNQISWTTENAVNFDHFEVERQTEGRTFGPIATVAFTSASQYTIFDNQPLATTNYYRLKMVDKDGKFSYSKVVAIVNSNSGFAISSVYPTITKGTVTVEGFSSANANIVSSVFNLSGQKVLEQTNATSQSFKQSVDFSKLAQGVYILKLSNGDSQKVFKIVKE